MHGMHRNRMIIAVITIAAQIGFLFTVYLIIKLSIDYKRKYNSFVDFLLLEDDQESLKKIGYVSFYGEEHGLRRSFSFTDAYLHLCERYEETGKSEYCDFAGFIYRLGKIRIPLVIAFFLTGTIGVSGLNL